MAIAPSIQTAAAWVLRSGLRDHLTELVPVLLQSGVSDLDKLTRDDVQKMKEKLSKKSFQALSKKFALHASGSAGGIDGSPSKKKRKPIEAPSLPTPDKVQEEDLEAVVFINRAPVLQLWCTCCCQVLGMNVLESLALAGSFVKDMSDRKRKILGLHVEKPESAVAKEDEIPKTIHTAFGFEIAIPSNADDLEIAADKSLRYIKNAFGEDFHRFYNAMHQRAESLGKESIVGPQAYEEYERFRPPTSHGTKGFGEKGRFKLRGILG